MISQCFIINRLVNLYEICKALSLMILAIVTQNSKERRMNDEG